MIHFRSKRVSCITLAALSACNTLTGPAASPTGGASNGGAPCEQWIAAAQQQCDSSPPPHVLAQLDPHVRELHNTCRDPKSQPALAQLDGCMATQMTAATAARDTRVAARRAHSANPVRSGQALHIDVEGVTDGVTGEMRQAPRCSAKQPRSSFEVKLEGDQLCVTATTYLVTPVTRGPVAMNPRGFIVATDTVRSPTMIESESRPQRVGDCTYDGAGGVEPVVLWTTSTRACKANGAVLTPDSHIVRVLDAASGGELVGWVLDG